MSDLLVRMWIDTALVVLAGLSLGLIFTGLAAVGAQRKKQNGESEIPVRPGPFDTEHRIEHRVYRHHRLFALSVLIGCALYLWQMQRVGLAWPDAAAAAWGVHWAWRAVSLIVGLLMVLAVVMFWRPSALRGLERTGNRWYGRTGRGSSPWLSVVAGVYCFGAVLLLLTQRLN